MKRSYDVVFLTSLLTEFRVPLFTSISRRLQEKGLSSIFVFATKSESHRRSVVSSNLEFDNLVLPGFHVRPLKKSRFTLHVNFGVTKLLRQLNPRILVVAGITIPAMYQAIAFGKRNNIILINWSETWNGSINNNYKLANLIRKKFYGSCNGFLVPGSKQLAFISKYLNNKELDFCFIPNSVEEDRTQLIVKERENRHFESEKQTIILCISMLEKRKGVHLLLRALQKVKNKDYLLRVLGDGPERENLDNLARELGLCMKVEFRGFVNREEVFRNLSECTFFVHPTLRDPSPLSVIEALQSGVYSLVSKHAGNSDLIINHINGVEFDPVDLEIFQEQIDYTIEMFRSSNYPKPNEISDSVKNTYLGNVACQVSSFLEKALHSSRRYDV